MQTAKYDWESPLREAIHKHGAVNFKVETLAVTDNEETLSSLEKHFIKLHESRHPDKGYNIILGGGGCKKNNNIGVCGPSRVGYYTRPETSANVKEAQQKRRLREGNCLCPVIPS